MKKIKFSIGSLAGTATFSHALARFGSVAVEENVEYDRLVNEIAAITQASPDEVSEFYRSHSYSLDYIKQSALMGAKLDADDMKNTLADTTWGIEEVIENLIPKKTWKDHLTDIPYYLAYWFSYPFFWLAFWLWRGIMHAKEEVWD